MKKVQGLLAVALGICGVFICAAPAFAGGVFSTDRFGYSGVVTRYDTLNDAELGQNAIDVVNIVDRDASF